MALSLLFRIPHSEILIFCCFLEFLVFTMSLLQSHKLVGYTPLTMVVQILPVRSGFAADD
jgi:hypothetical protein